MSLEMEIARDRIAKLRIEADEYRLSKQFRSGTRRGGWRSRLFAASRWGGSHRGSGQLM